MSWRAAVRKHTHGVGLARPDRLRHAADDRRRYHDLTPLICVTAARSISPQIRGALRYIDHQYACGLTLGRVAGQVGYHHAHLSRKFHQELGVSFSRYLASIRLKHAIRLLVYTDVPIKTVGYRVGFASPERFAKVFGQWLRASPTAFRTFYRYQGATIPRATA